MFASVFVLVVVFVCVVCVVLFVNCCGVFASVQDCVDWCVGFVRDVFLHMVCMFL